MADNPQSVGFSRGINTPTVSDVEQLVFKNGHNHRVSDFNLTYPGSGAGDLKFSLLVSPSIAAVFSLKLAIAGITFTANLHASGKYNADPSKMDAGVFISSTSSDDSSVIQFKKAELVRTGTSLSLVVTLALNTASTVVTGTASAIGQSVSLNVVPYASLSNPTTFPHKYAVAQDSMAINYFRDSTNVNINLNTQIAPGTFSCNPASSASKPTGMTGYGACFVFGSAGYLAQMFVTDNGFSFTRYTTNGGNSWSTWNTLGDTSAINAKVDKTSSLGSNLDANTALTSGFFDFVAITANAPVGFSGSGNLLVTSSGSNVTQLLFSGSANQFWMRTALNSASTWTWGSWSKFITDGDVNTAIASGITEKVDKATSSSSIDANTLISTGFYRSTVSSTNMPSDSTGKDSIIVSAVSNTVAQLVVNQSTGRLWSRTGTFAASAWTWSAWVRCVGMDEIPALTTPSVALQRAYYNNCSVVAVNGTVVVPGTTYSVDVTAGSIYVHLPTKANTNFGDRVTFLNSRMSWPNSSKPFYIYRFESNIFIHGIDDHLLVDKSLGAFTLICTYKSGDGSVVHWAIC